MADLNVSDEQLKSIRETLCLAQSALIGWHYLSYGIDHLQNLINEIDRHRPLDNAGLHGDLHTPTCGCEDKNG